jgi:hypothetical protein
MWVLLKSGAYVCCPIKGDEAGSPYDAVHAGTLYCPNARDQCSILGSTQQHERGLSPPFGLNESRVLRMASSGTACIDLTRGYTDKSNTIMSYDRAQHTIVIICNVVGRSHRSVVPIHPNA